MLKVLIADDENKICQLIEKLVDWKALDMEVVATAENGIEALEKINSTKPDIAITDIRMPGLDGLELISKCKQLSPKLEFIIISGYRHFEYAQTAIKHGVSAYLLKPIKKEELVATLKEISEHIKETSEQLSYDERMRIAMRSDEELLRTTYISKIVYGYKNELTGKTLDDINKEYHYNLKPGLFGICIIKIDGHIIDDNRNMEFIMDKAKALIYNNLSECSYDRDIYIKEGFIYVLINTNETCRADIRKQFRVVLDELMVQESILQGISVTIAMGMMSEDIEELSYSLNNARYLIEDRLISGTGKVMEGDTHGGGGFIESSAFTEFNSQMGVALESLDSSQIRDVLKKLKDVMLSSEHTTGHEVLQMTKEACNLYLYFLKDQRIGVAEGFLEDYNSGADNCQDAGELFDYLVRKIVVSYDKAATLKKQEEYRPIRLAKQYIEQHYGDALTLDDVSSVVGLSPTYFSTVFKKDTNSTFLEYLSKVRMDMAKKLLKETSYQVASICEQVGYSDVKYFTKTFTKYSGLKPNEYRKLYS